MKSHATTVTTTSTGAALLLSLLLIFLLLNDICCQTTTKAPALSGRRFFPEKNWSHYKHQPVKGWSSVKKSEAEKEEEEKASSELFIESVLMKSNGNRLWRRLSSSSLSSSSSSSSSSVVDSEDAATAVVDEAAIPKKSRATIALHHANRRWLYDMLIKVSDPDGPQYGEYWTLDQIDEMISPPGTHVNGVLSWLKSFETKGVRVSHTSRGKDFIVVDFPAALSMELFGCKLIPFENVRTGQIVLRADRLYSVPEEFSHAIAFVGDLIRFPNSNQRRKRDSSLKKLRSYRKSMRVASKMGAENFVTPDVIRKYYNVSSSLSRNPSRFNSQAVASFLEQYYDETDLQLFWKRFNVAPSKIRVLGVDDMDKPGEEANLDIQYITAIGEGIPTWFVSNEGLHEGQETFLKWVVNMSQTQDSPWVHSVSYGDIEGSISKEYALRVEDEFVKLGISGRTILFASGDSGVGCNADRNQFVPEWPGSSPSVLSVGATRIDTDSEMSEEAWTSSGGGFSNYFPMPEYQFEAVKQYWSNDNLPATSFYNVTGRAYPDISALGVNYLIAHRGEFMPVDGTSASTPTFAGVLSLINSVRLNAGKSTLGFVNPLIYKKWSRVPGAFRDITFGRNSDDGECPGFPCKPGYDPVTGFGTPNAGVLAALALSV